jgi:hypothetical protein
MSHKSNLAHASLAACALSLLSSSSWAAVVTVHMPTPVVPPPVHSAPVISVKPPVAGVKLPVRSSIALSRGSQRLVNDGNTTGRNWPGRNSGGTQTVSSSGVVVTQGSTGKTVSSSGVVVTQGSDRQTASPGNTVYSATTTGTGRNWPVQVGVPNEWPTQVTGTNVPPTEFWINNPIYPTYPGAGVQHITPISALLTTAEQEADNWFVGTLCSAGQGYNAFLNINSANPINSSSAAVTGSWNTAGGPEGNENFSGTITQNANGTYTLTFSLNGMDYTITFIWNPGRGGGYWTLTNGTITNAQGQQTGTWGVGNCSPI